MALLLAKYLELGKFILFMVPKKIKNFIKNNRYKTIKIKIDNIGIRHFSDD